MAGSSNISGEESIMFADNASFDGTERDGRMTTDGELWMGAADSPHVRLGNLVAGSGITLTYSNPTSTTAAISVAATGGGASALTVTTDDATVVSPVSMNWNLSGLGESSTQSSGDPDLQILSPRCSPWVVDPTQYYGTHQTIAAAVAAASANDTILVRPGTYSDNFSVTTTLNIMGLPGVGDTASVVISGKITHTSGVLNIASVRFAASADYNIVTSGSTGRTVRLSNCDLVAGGNAVIQATGSNDTVNVHYCRGSITSTGHGLFAKTSTGDMQIGWSKITSSTVNTSSTVSGGQLFLLHSELQIPFQTSSTAVLKAQHCVFAGFAGTYLDITGTASTHTITNSYFDSGSAIAIAIGSGSTALISSLTVLSTNTDPIDGAGNATISNVGFLGTGSGIGTSGISSRELFCGLLRATSGSTGGVAMGYFDDEDTGFYRSGANTHCAIAGTTVGTTWTANTVASNILHAFYSGIVRATTTPGAYPYSVLDASDDIVLVDSSVARTINLPNAPTTSRQFTIKDAAGNAGSANISVTTPGGTVTIDGSTTYTMNVNYGSITVIFDGTNYLVI